MRGLALVIQFLAQPLADLGMDLVGGDGAVVALVEREEEFQLLQIGFDRRAHIGILQLAGERGAVLGDGAMHLAQRGGARRFVLEALEALLPILAELARHAALDERPAHRRRVRLQRGELARVFLRQRVGDGGEKLRHLHQRTFDAAERARQLGRMFRPVDLDAEIALAGEARGKAAHRGRDPRIAPDAAREAVVVGHGSLFSPTPRVGR